MSVHSELRELNALCDALDLILEIGDARNGRHAMVARQLCDGIDEARGAERTLAHPSRRYYSLPTAWQRACYPEEG